MIKLNDRDSFKKHKKGRTRERERERKTERETGTRGKMYLLRHDPNDLSLHLGPKSYRPQS